MPMAKPLPPGDYFVAAVSGMSVLREGVDAWQDPEFLDSIALRATHVTLTDGAKLSIAPHLITPLKDSRPVSSCSARPPPDFGPSRLLSQSTDKSARPITANRSLMRASSSTTTMRPKLCSSLATTDDFRSLSCRLKAAA